MADAPTERPRPGALRGEPLGPYEEVTLHGHKVGFQAAGEGPLLILLHGITSTSDAWRDVMPSLAERYTVIAPDLLGHGRSAKPRGDYSLGAYAAGVRDLLAVLGFERGTVVGHSLGGGIAMQFAYLFPEYIERMALISSGGLGNEVHPLLRAADPARLGVGAAAAGARVVGDARATPSARSPPSSASRPAPTWRSSRADTPPWSRRAPPTPSSTPCAA